MRYAHELGKARLSGDVERIKSAERTHDNYVKICLEADEMIGLGTVGDMGLK
jgi:hypothetical protein